MKTNKYIVAFDMLPLSKERLESWDYNSMIFFKMFGNPILDIDKNVVIEGKRVIVQNLSKDTLISIEKKLDYILNNWTDIHALWFIGIKITKDNHIYTKKNNSIYVDFSDEKRIYPFLCLLKSYFFYIEEDSVNIIWGKRKIEVTNTLIDKTIILKKIKYPVINILLFQLHNIDITANTIFPFRLYPIYKKSSLFFSEKSGIEMLLICTNPQSNYYNNKMLRQCIFEKIDSKLILNKLECNLCFSENMYIDYFPDDKHYSDKVVISYAKELDEAAEKLSYYGESDGDCITNEEGIAKIEDLDVGVYLLYVSEQKNYEKVMPVLIAVPTWEEEEGMMLYNVKVFPKHTPITEECIQETKKQSSVKTGDSLDVWIWLTGMVIAIGITGVVLRIKNKKE